MASLFNLRNILVIALIFRLFSVVFSKGYAFSDDHFEIVETAQKWMDGIPIVEKGEVYLFSLLYVGVHTAIFWLCESVGIFDPQGKMYIVRLIHALFSMLTVYYGYKLAKKIDGDKTSTFGFSKSVPVPEVVAFLLAVFWVFPFMSVRSLREFVCVPLITAAFYHLYTISDKKKTLLPLIYAGFLMALAFVFRYQAVFFPLGAGLVLLFSKKTWKQGLLFGIFFIIFVSGTQFLFDYLYWGNPLASLTAYFEYNSTHSQDYPNGEWFMYILTVGGLLLAPACFLFFTGFFYTWKKHFLLFFPTLLFFVFHSYFPNKQERFILPFFPFIIILGVIGYAAFYEKNHTISVLKNSTKILIIWFLVLNTLGLTALTFTYTKRSRVESMSYLYRKGDLTNFIIEGEGGIQFPPTFYLGKHINFYEIKSDRTVEDLQKEIKSGLKTQPNYIIFTGSNNLEKRVERIKMGFPSMKLEANIEPSFVDNIAYVLNPKHNVNESWYIYKIR